jgi:hypothetical protein
MTNTPFSKQVDIVADYYMGYVGDAVYDELINTFDLGFILAVALRNGGVDGLTNKGMDWITEAYYGILAYYGNIDKHTEFDSIEDIMHVVLSGE